jgi:hypothetical protein
VIEPPTLERAQALLTVGPHESAGLCELNESLHALNRADLDAKPASIPWPSRVPSGVSIGRAEKRAGPPGVDGLAKDPASRECRHSRDGARRCPIGPRAIPRGRHREAAVPLLPVRRLQSQLFLNMGR